MAPMRQPLVQHGVPARRSVSSRESSASLSSDLDDEITPAVDDEPLSSPTSSTSASSSSPTAAMHGSAQVLAETNPSAADDLSPHRRSTSSSLSSTSSSGGGIGMRRGRRGSVFSDKLEACSRGDADWHFDPAEGEELDTARLWKRMLALQRRFHCYQSARMSAALASAEVEAVVPPRVCLDLLNDSIAKLPEEARREVEDFIDSREPKRSGKRRSLWHISLQYRGGVRGGGY